MKLNLKNPIVFFDLETTGTNINTDRIVEICYLKVYPNGNEEAKTLRINPEMHIPKHLPPCMAFMTLTWQIARLSRKWQRILPATLKDATWPDSIPTVLIFLCWQKNFCVPGWTLI